MTYGLSIVNPSGELVVSSDAKLLHYLGKATLEKIVQVSGDATQDKGSGRNAGYSTYILSLPTDQISFALAIDLPVGMAVGITDLQWLSAGQYRITAYCGSNAYDGWNFDMQQSAVSIWAFGFVNSLASNYGLALYDKNGNLAADFSRPNPFIPAAVVTLGMNASQAIPSLSRPIVLGQTNYYYGDIYPRSTGFQYDYKKEADFWMRTDATTLKCVRRSMVWYGCNDLNDDNGYGNSPGGTCMVSEGARLP